MDNEIKDYESLIESKELRDKLIERVDVLDKVKDLLLNTECATLNQVASFYEVDSETIKKAYQRNKDEIDMDGVSVKNYNYFLTGQNCTIKNLVGKSIIYYSDGEEIIIPNRGINVFPRRAILRIGMLLRDSNIAKEVRTQLLNIEEKTTEEVKLKDINEEQKLMLEIGMAVASGNATAVAIASSNLIEFKNRYIKKIEVENLKVTEDNKKLAYGNMTWEDRSSINYAIRNFASQTGGLYGKVWNELYSQLKYKFHIDLKARGNSPYIQYVKESEWDKVMIIFSSMCTENSISPTEILKNVRTKSELSK